MKTKLLSIIFFLMLIGAVNNSFAQQEKLDITLVQPPPNQLSTKDMWKMTLNNKSGNDMKIYITGTATEEKDGLIVEGKSKVFTIKPGKTSYKYNDFTGAEIKYNKSKYKEIMLRTGNAPEGSYTICVTAFDENGTEVGRENCIMQTVKQMGSLTLLTPGDGDEIDLNQPVMFTWTPLSSPLKEGYSFKIAEVKEGKSPEEALNIWPWYDKQCPPNCIFENKFVLPLGEKKFETGKKYAWQVTNGEIRSEVSTFSIRSNTHAGLEIDSIVCTGIPGEYRFWLKICVEHDNTQFSSIDVNSLSFTNNCVPNINYTISGLTPALPQTITKPATGTNCLSFTGIITTTPVSISTFIEFLATATYGPETHQVFYSTDNTEPKNNCCLPINQLPPMVGWWSIDEISGTTFFDRADFNNQGVLNGTASFINDAMVDGAMNFNNGHIVVDNHPDLNIYLCDSLSIDAWIKTSSNATIAIVEKREITTCGTRNNPSSIGYSFFVRNGKLGFQLGNGVSIGNYLAPVTSPSINDDKWHFVAITLQRTNSNTIIKLYIDGTEVHTENNGMPGSFNNASPLLIGCIQTGFWNGDTRFNGIIDEVEMFKRVLTQQQIQFLFNAGEDGKCKN